MDSVESIPSIFASLKDETMFWRKRDYTGVIANYSFCNDIGLPRLYFQFAVDLKKLRSADATIQKVLYTANNHKNSAKVQGSVKAAQSSKYRVDIYLDTIKIDNIRSVNRVRRTPWWRRILNI
jgi:hypothetical protein